MNSVLFRPRDIMRAWALVLFASWVSAHLAIGQTTITKADNQNALNSGSSWAGGVGPGVLDTALWDSTVTGANTVSLGANQSYRGLRVTNAGGAIAIAAGNTLTLGTGGIDMSTATQNLTISSGLTLGAGNQVWNVASGRTLTLNTGAFTRSAGATLNLSGTGTVSASMTGLANTNGIIGPWATVGSGANTRYATLSAGNIVGFTGGTAATAFGWTSTNNNAFNYDVAGVQGALGVARQANTVRYTGASGTQLWGSGTNNTTIITLNGLLNVGTGTLTFGQTGGTTLGRLAIGTNNSNELVLNAANSSININSPIINTGTTAGSVVVTGPNAISFGETNTFTGDLIVNGTLNAGTGQGAAPTGSNLGALQPVTNRNIIVNDGGTLSLTGGNVLGQGGSTNTLSNTTLVVNQGGQFRTGLDGAGAGWWNKVGATNLNGGTIRVGSGANTGVFQGLALIGTVTVGGSAASSIENFAASNSASNGVHLGQNATANQSITFDVADVTGSSASDLNVSTRLLNTSANLTASGLTKTGAGTMTLSATNAYTGATVISGGTLQIGNGTTDGSIATSSGITNNANLGFNLTGSHSYANAITGTGNLTKTGAGSLTVSGASNYSGNTTLSGGSLNLRGTIGAVSIADATSNAFGNATTGALTMSSLTMGGDATLNLNLNAAPAFNVIGALTTSPANGIVTINAGNSLWGIGTNSLISYGSFSGSLSDFTLGTVTGLTGRQVSNGLINTGSAIALDVAGDLPVWTGANGSVWTTSAVGDNAGANVNWGTKAAQTATNFWAADTPEFNDTYTILGVTTAVTNRSVDIQGADVSPGLVTFNNSTGDYTLSSSTGNGIIGAAGLVKSGTSALIITNANTFTGATTINAGTLQLGNGVTNGSIGSSTITNNGALVYNTTGTQSFSHAVTGTGTIAKTGSGTLTLSTNTASSSGGTSINAGRLIANSSFLNGGAISLASGATLTFTGNNSTSTSTITGSGAILNDSANTIVFTGNHSGFNGTFTHSAAANNSQFNTAQSTSANAAYNISAGEMIFAGAGDYTIQMGSLASTGGNIRGTNSLTGTVTLEVGNLNTNTSIAGNLNSGTQKVIALTKVGSGTLTLSGTNGYTGVTNVNAGTLAISGSKTGTGAIAIASGATLNVGTGVADANVAGAIAVNGALSGRGTLGAVTVGNSASNLIANGNGGTGALTMSSLTFNGAATANLALGSGPGLNVTGALTTTPSNGLVTINASKTGWSIGDNQLIGFGTFAGNASDFSLGTLTGLGARQGAGALAVSGNNLVVGITGLTTVWSGAGNNAWTTVADFDNSGANNWSINSQNTATNFWASDTVAFNDTYNIGGGDVAVTNRDVNIQGGNVVPGAVTFNNSNGDYTLSSSSGNGITGSTSLIKSGTSALNITNNNTYTGATTINAGTVNLSGGLNSTAISVANGASLNVTSTGVISGASSLNTSGNVLIAGTNTYTGATTINAGTVNLSGGLNGTAITVANGASLNVTSTGVISGASSLNTSGNVLIAGTNTYTGATTIAAGASIQLGDGATNGSLGLSVVTNNGTLAFNSVGTQTAANVIGGSGTLTKSGAGTLTLSGNNSFTGDLTINGGTVAAGTAQGTAPTTSNLGALQPTANRNITINNGGTLSLTAGNVLGTGSSTNTLANTTLVVNAGGTFQTGLNGAGAGWWNKIGATNLNGGTIRVGSGADAANFQGLALIGNVTVSGSTASSIENFAVTTATANGVHLGQNATAGQSIVFNVADVTSSTATDLNLSTRLLNTSSTNTASGLTKTGAGTLTLSGINTYSGGTILTAGTLDLRSTSAIGTGNLTINGGSLDNGSGAAIALTTNNTQTWASDFAFAGSNNLSLGNGVTTLTGGDRTVTLSNNSTLGVGRIASTAGGLSVAGSGRLALTQSTASSITGALNVGANATLQLNTGADASTTADFNSASLSGSGTVVNGGGVQRLLVVNGTANSTFAGQLQNGGTGALGLSKQGAGTLTLSGTNNTMTGAVSVNTGGTLEVTGSLANASGYTIGSTGGAAVLRVNSATANSLGNNAINFDGQGNTSTARLELVNSSLANSINLTGRNNSSVAIQHLSGNSTVSGTITLGTGGGTYSIQSDSGTLNLSNATSAAAGVRNLTLGGAGNLNVTGVLSNGAGTMALTKSGLGTVTLSGANTYTGATTVSAGTLNVTGSLASSSLNVASGATFNLGTGATVAGSMTVAGTLSGNGSYTNNVTVTGTHSVGNSPGLQSFTSLTYDNATFKWELIDNTIDGRGINFDAVNGLAGSTLTFTNSPTSDLVFNFAGSTVDWTNSFWSLNRSWTVFDGFANITGSPFSISSISADGNNLAFGSGFTSGSSFNWSVDGSKVLLNYTVVAVPEPSSFVMLGVMGLGAMLHRRRKAKKVTSSQLETCKLSSGE